MSIMGPERRSEALVGVTLGSWELRVPRPHECALPTLSDETGPGSIWRCGCGKRWKVVEHRHGLRFDEIKELEEIG